MEFNAHLTAIQGTLISVEKVVGPFIRIKYKGDNEEKISKVEKAIDQYLSSKNFIKDKISNPNCSNELQNITMFLLLNTKFECNSLLDNNELSHLRNIVPPLSTCLVANIIIDLDLALYYSKLMSKLPIWANLELLNESIICIKHIQPENAVEYTYFIINEIILILSSSQDQDATEKLLDICSEMLKNISAINADWLPKRKLKQIHQHMGFTLMYFLRLLRKCPVNATNFTKLVNNLINVALMLMKSVTINVFCVWAEVCYEDQPLQSFIAGEAYLVIEHLHGYKPALELVQILGTIAKKPKTLKEIINESDISTMINKINKCESDQKDWFNAFVNNNPLQNQDTLECLNKWSNLCNKNDLSVILNWSVSYKEQTIKNTVLKCADNLNIEELSAVSARYLVEKGTNNLDTGTINDQLKVLLNKLEVTTKTDNYFIKQIHLMLLQNPKWVITCLFEKCTANVGIISCLKPTFNSIKSVVKTNDVAKMALLDVLQRDPPGFQNLSCYIQLINALLDLSYFNESLMVGDILVPLMENPLEKSTSIVLNTLQIFQGINLQYKLQHDTISVIAVLLNIMEKHRCQFLTFSNIDQQIVHQCVGILLKYNNSSNMDEIKRLSFKDFLDNLQVTNELNKFYINIFGSTYERNFLTSIYSTYNINNVVGLLEMILPSCVEQEWIYIVEELENKFGFETTYLLLINVFTLLCQLTNSHKGDNSEQLNNGLKYCLELYGIIIKDVFRQKHSNLQEEIFLTKNVCKLLASIPQEIRKTDGVGLIQLLSTESLQALKDDKAFIFLLVSIKDVTVSQMIAKKMIS